MCAASTSRPASANGSSTPSRKKGEFGYETWTTPGQAEASGNMGVWAPMSADPELGLVYVGVELPQTDLLGVSRTGNHLFSESLVALDIETGVRKWHYQMVHHGIWDRDVSCAGVICDIPHNGKIVKAIAQPTKQGFVYVLDRATGKPVWPIPEKPVAKGNVPGEWYSPTQPFPPRAAALRQAGHVGGRPGGLDAADQGAGAGDRQPLSSGPALRSAAAGQ